MIANVNSRTFHQDCDECKIATHFVSSVTWGANAVASFETSHFSDADEISVKAQIDATVKLLGIPDFFGSITADGKIGFNLNNTDVTKNTAVKIFGDLDMKTVKIPIS